MIHVSCLPILCTPFMLIDLLEIYIDLVMSYLHKREYFLPAGSVTTTYVLTILLENTLRSLFYQY